MEIYICFNQIKGKKYYTLLPPLNINKMKIFNLVFKIKKAETEKTSAVDHLKNFKMIHRIYGIYLNKKKRF